MKARLLFLLPATIYCLASTSCTSTYRAEGASGALAKREPVRVAVNPDDSGDRSCLRAIERELRSRGFQIVDGDRASLQVKMADIWQWDVVMYLLDLDLVFTDAASGVLRAQAHYRNSPFHGFPSQSRVVEKLFLQLDAKGVFQK